jgi:hypothetical protein
MEKALEISKYLTEREADFDDVHEHADGTIEIPVSWGDWKHSHLFLKDLMIELGYIQVKEEETEGNGSDCYSATHFFKSIN